MADPQGDLTSSTKRNVIIALAAVLVIVLPIYIARPADEPAQPEVDILTTEVVEEPATATNHDIDDQDTSAQDDDSSDSHLAADADNDSSHQATDDDEVASAPGLYLDYSLSAFAQHSDSIRLLSFHASWCGQCLALDEDITANTVPTGVVIFKVDYDNSQDLKKQYGVIQQTTVVRVDGSGKRVGLFGAYSNPTFQAVVDNLL